MNRSIVITRYARTLLKLVGETGDGERVVSEAGALRSAMDSVPGLREAIEARDVVSAPDKLKLLRSALGDNPSPGMDAFLGLVIRNGRAALVGEILRDFTDMYYRSVGIRRASLVTAGEPSPRLLERLRTIVREKTGYDVIIESSLDPDIVGGFVFDMDDYLLDASVRRQIDILREQFIQHNRRII